MQQRFLVAIALSALILFGWTYLFPPKPPAPAKPTGTAAGTEQPSPAASTEPSSGGAQTGPQSAAPEVAEQTAPRQVVHVHTPLYDVDLDNQGGVATSWIIRKIKEPGSASRDLYSAGGTKKEPLPLQLIPRAAADPASAGLAQGLREAPFGLLTGDANLDAALRSKNYQVSGADQAPEAAVVVADAETKNLVFSLNDPATGLTVSKTITFHGDRFNVEVTVKMERGGQAVPRADMIIGPSIGDQGVKRYSFYSVAPEGIAEVDDGSVQRIVAAAVHKNEGGFFSSKRPEGTDRQLVAGSVAWAGVGDTYFAMVAVPPERMQGLEYRTHSYQAEVNGAKEERYLISALVPVPVNGTHIPVYAGPKDHVLLNSASAEVSRELGGRPVDLEGLINYGWLSSMRRALAVPILWSINRLHDVTGSYGVAIIIFTIFIYSLFFPLKWRSSRAMKKAQKLAPRMKEIQEQIKGMKQTDPRLKELQMEQLRLMKEGNPLGGCLPLLIQMPFLFALYSAITVSIDFRQSSFLWMPDLSSGDPYHLLEILMAGSMMVLQLITPAPAADPLQRRMMAIGMPLFMLYVLWGAPAGLLVYWLVGNIVGFSQQFLINRLTRSEDDQEPPEGKRIGAPSPKKLSPAGAS